MRNALKVLFWIILGVISIVVIPWGIQSGWQVFQKYRPRYAPFTGSGTVIDGKTKQGIPGVYVLLKATGYREFKSLDFTPEGSRNSGDWYSGLCESLHVVTTDANGHYSYSIPPDKAFTYPWPYSVGFYVDFLDSKYYDRRGGRADDERNSVFELTRFGELRLSTQNYLADRRFPDCGDFKNENGFVKAAFLVLLRNQWEEICRNECWYSEVGPEFEKPATPHRNTLDNLTSSFAQLAKDIDRFNAMLESNSSMQKSITESWDRDGKKIFSFETINGTNARTEPTDEQVQIACAYFAANFQKHEVTK
jgi:hypothetical protein